MLFTRSTAAAAIALIALTGCRAPNVDAIISNRTSTPLTLIEVDYPSASFGTQSLSPSMEFRYSFSVIGSGPLVLHYTDATGKDHTSTGPTVAEGARGTLQILITPAPEPNQVQWQPAPTLHATPTPNQ